MSAVRIDLLTREYPPAIYGGAGVHVAELVRSLRAAGTQVQVRCFGEPVAEPDTTGYSHVPDLAGLNPALATFGVNLGMAADCAGASLVHSHTWYAALAGRMAGLLHGIPTVVTAHSLEPLRPWKAEQLGGGYALSSWAEQAAIESADAVIAVSAAMRADVLRTYPSIDPGRMHVVHNGIDPERWYPVTEPEVLVRLGMSPERPIVLFVGRITRQKGLPYLLRAAASLEPDVQLVICAGSPDTPELLAEVAELIRQLRQTRTGVHWIQQHLPSSDLRALYSAATVFVCPSIYEPLGIVNLEAMACSVAVVATATGGIPEVVADGHTGRLVPIEQQLTTGVPLDPARFIADLAAALTEALGNPSQTQAWAAAGRVRAVTQFSWQAIASVTEQIYRSLLR